MRLLHVHSGNLYGGVERVLVTLAQLAPRESTFALSAEGRLAAELRAVGAEVHLIGAVRASRPLSIRAARERLRALEARQHFDASVFHSTWSLALLGAAVRAPRVFSVHDDLSGHHWLESWALRTPLRLLVANSAHTARAASRLFRKTRLRVVHPPAALTRRTSSSTHKDVVIAHAGRFETWKGHLQLIDALRVLRDVPGWRVAFAGEPQRKAEADLMRTIQKHACENGVLDRIEFTGFVSNMGEWLRSADIYCQPNTAPEPFGLAFVEALDAGIPVVSSDFGGASEIVTENCGVLTPPNNRYALALALFRLIRDPARRQVLGQAGPERARALCDPARQAAAFHAAVEEVL